jgi:hypothetical protein
MNAPIRIPNRSVVAVAKERPFDGRVHVIPVEADRRLSIADVLASIPDLPPDFADICEARINGERVPRELWARVYPKNNPFVDVTVHFTIPMRGGGGASGSGGGQKNPLAMIASIAVLLVAAVVSGGALGALGSFAIGQATFTGAQVLGLGISIGGALEVDALGGSK